MPPKLDEEKPRPPTIPAGKEDEDLCARPEGEGVQGAGRMNERDDLNKITRSYLTDHGWDISPEIARDDRFQREFFQPWLRKMTALVLSNLRATLLDGGFVSNERNEARVQIATKLQKACGFIGGAVQLAMREGIDVADLLQLAQIVSREQQLFALPEVDAGTEKPLKVVGADSPDTTTTT